MSEIEEKQERRQTHDRLGSEYTGEKEEETSCKKIREIETAADGAHRQRRVKKKRDETGLAMACMMWASMRMGVN